MYIYIEGNGMRLFGENNHWWEKWPENLKLTASSFSKLELKVNAMKMTMQENPSAYKITTYFHLKQPICSQSDLANVFEMLCVCLLKAAICPPRNYIAP